MLDNNFDNEGAQLILSMLKTNYVLIDICSGLAEIKDFFPNRNKSNGPIIEEIEKEILKNRVISKLIGWPKTDELLPLKWRFISDEFLLCCENIPFEIIAMIINYLFLTHKNGLKT